MMLVLFVCVLLRRVMNNYVLFFFLGGFCVFCFVVSIWVGVFVEENRDVMR